ncbi:MAG TPA: hypothetical protein PKU70_01625 [Vicinamibacteria bacterium]|nr:hypothetical protein [Vicinamibacteria bacterium]
MLALTCLAVAPSCRSATGPSLANTLESPEAVARAVVRGLAEKDLEALRALAVTEAEFRDLVWPKLPASRPERNLPLDYVWGDLSTKSDANLRARLGGWVDRGFVLVSVSFAGATDDYGTYRVHRETVLLLRDRDGKEQTGRLFGSMIEHRGRFKVFSYVVD